VPIIINGSTTITANVTLLNETRVAGSVQVIESGIVVLNGVGSSLNVDGNLSLATSSRMVLVIGQPSSSSATPLKVGGCVEFGGELELQKIGNEVTSITVRLSISLLSSS
jgi:hypothetical protein